MITILHQRSLKYSLKEFLKIKKNMGIDQELDTYYFGYGANLSIERFQKWYIPAEVIGTAYLNDYQIKFNLPCEYKGKGFAGVEKEQGKKVWGVLFRLNSKALKMLDVLEWVPFNFYERKIFTVVSNGDTYNSVHSYVTCNPRNNLIPSKGYLDFIIQAGIKADFPPDYLSELALTKTKSDFEIDSSFVLSNPAKTRLLAKELAEIYRVHDKLREKISRIIP